MLLSQLLCAACFPQPPAGRGLAFTLRPLPVGRGLAFTLRPLPVGRRLASTLRPFPVGRGLASILRPLPVGRGLAPATRNFVTVCCRNSRWLGQAPTLHSIVHTHTLPSATVRFRTPKSLQAPHNLQHRQHRGSSPDTPA